MIRLSGMGNSFPQFVALTARGSARDTRRRASAGPRRSPGRRWRPEAGLGALRIRAQTASTASACASGVARPHHARSQADSRSRRISGFSTRRPAILKALRPQQGVEQVDHQQHGHQANHEILRVHPSSSLPAARWAPAVTAARTPRRNPNSRRKRAPPIRQRRGPSPLLTPTAQFGRRHR